MSIQAMNHYMEHGCYDSTEVLVLLILANFADEDGTCWPKIDTIAGIARLDPGTVKRVVKRLSDPETCEALGRTPAIRVDRNAGSSKHARNPQAANRKSNRYTLLDYALMKEGALTFPRQPTASIFKPPKNVQLPTENVEGNADTTEVKGNRRALSWGDPAPPQEMPVSASKGDPALPQWGDPAPPQPLEVRGGAGSPDPLIITINKDEPPINIEEEEEDSVIHLWNVLEKIVDRPLTRNERILLEQTCGDEIGQDCALFAIEGLKVAWLKPDFRMRHDVTSYLQKVIANERKNREIQSKQRREKYMPTRPDAFEVEERPAPISAYEAALKNEPVSTQPVALSPHEELWKKTLGELQLQLATGTFTSWLQNTKAVPGEGDTITVAAANLYARDWLENRLKGMIRRTLKIITGNSTIDVEFVLREPNLPNASMA